MHKVYFSPLKKNNEEKNNEEEEERGEMTSHRAPTGTESQQKPHESVQITSTLNKSFFFFFIQPHRSEGFHQDIC